MMISNSVLFKLFAFVCLFVPLLASSEEKTCAEVTVRDYKYTNSYNLSSIFNSQLDESIDTKNSDLIKGVSSEEYLVKLPVTFETRRGDIHVAFSEFPYSENSNRVYEFLLGGYENTLFEIRRKDYLHEKRNFNGNRFSDHSVPIYEEFNVEFSISKNGVVQLRDLDTDFKFNFTDQLPVIPVRYVSFAGYNGSPSKVSFNCVNIATETEPPTTTEEQPPTTTEDSLQNELDSIVELDRLNQKEVEEVTPEILSQYT